MAGEGEKIKETVANIKSSLISVAVATALCLLLLLLLITGVAFALKHQSNEISFHQIVDPQVEYFREIGMSEHGVETLVGTCEYKGDTEHLRHLSSEHVGARSIGVCTTLGLKDGPAEDDVFTEVFVSVFADLEAREKNKPLGSAHFQVSRMGGHRVASLVSFKRSG